MKASDVHAAADLLDQRIELASPTIAAGDDEGGELFVRLVRVDQFGDEECLLESSDDRDIAAVRQALEGAAAREIADIDAKLAALGVTEFDLPLAVADQNEAS